MDELKYCEIYYFKLIYVRHKFAQLFDIIATANVVAAHSIYLGDRGARCYNFADHRRIDDVWRRNTQDCYIPQAIISDFRRQF